MNEWVGESSEPPVEWEAPRAITSQHSAPRLLPLFAPASDARRRRPRTRTHSTTCRGRRPLLATNTLRHASLPRPNSYYPPSSLPFLQSSGCLSPYLAAGFLPRALRFTVHLLPRSYVIQTRRLPLVISILTLFWYFNRIEAKLISDAVLVSTPHLKSPVALTKDYNQIIQLIIHGWLVLVASSVDVDD